MLFSRFLRMVVRVHKKLNREKFNARVWSNEVLRLIAPQITGDVVNVSGGIDADKSGGFYRNYFSQADSYLVTNFGDASDNKSTELDLETSALPPELKEQFDAVFTHTVLEHVFHIDTAIRNLCSMSRDIVITVVPFIQSFHHGQWYSDYWRFTPPVLMRLFDKYGFKTVFMKWNKDPLGNIYLVHVATKNPASWAHLLNKDSISEYGPGFERTQMISGDSEATRIASVIDIKITNDYYDIVTK